MPDIPLSSSDFLTQVTATIEQNMANEQFGVAELADAMNMSRSNLLRKVKKDSNLSVNQLIGQVRNSSLNVSEVSHQVGFNSTSYFIKCFREQYGYPPGEVGEHDEAEIKNVIIPVADNRKKKIAIWATIAVAFSIGTGLFLYHILWPAPPLEKSIAVLPFKNDSVDSTNIYLINGLMESTLTNLQKIKDLKVISRTSSEKYRNTSLSIPEMAKELNVSYFVEGSGQKIGNQILLNIQLIEAGTDRHLWARQYKREAKDIFELQQEIAKNIAEEIKAIITPEEKDRIEKVYTKNAEAYDAFLKGLDLLNRSGDDNLRQSLVYFDDAIEKDHSFALAYACAGMSCYYLDLYHSEKKHLEKLSLYADNAMLHDPTLGESLIAKGMHYLIRKEYAQALPYLEKGLEYYPNSSQLIGLLADFYANNLPNTGKYLEYALKGARLGANSSDSVSSSYFYLRLGNALIQTGFVDESLLYLDKSLAYFPENAFSHYVRAFVLFAKNKDLKQTQQLLQIEYHKDTTRFDILQDIGKVSYYLGEYDTAYYYYQRFNSYRERHKLDVYQHENFNIGLVYGIMGEKEKEKAFIKSYLQYLETDQTAYKNLGYALYYCRSNESKKAIEHLRLFAREDNIQYWIILFMDYGPEPTQTEQLPEFKKIIQEIEKKFWQNHEKLKARLQEEGVM
jgi:TolB-like protein/AraC-like DNA-binding protein